MQPLTEPTVFIPAFTDRCINCHSETDDPIYLRHYLAHFITDKPVCPDCIEDVTYNRYMCRNVSDMTGELREQNDWKLHSEMGNKLVPHRNVNHI